MRVRFMYLDGYFRLYTYAPFPDDALIKAIDDIKEVLRERYASVDFYVDKPDRFEFRDQADTAAFLLFIMPLDVCGWSAIMEL